MNTKHVNTKHVNLHNYNVKVNGKKLNIITVGDNCFEPKICSRFIVKLTNIYTKEIIPSQFIKSIDRPSKYKNFFSTTKYYPLNISLYDPISPSIPYLMESNNMFGWNIEINILGPVGDIVETWNIKSAKLKKVKYSSFNWADTGNPAEIQLVFRIKNVTLL
jgi:hypothetical protein